MYAIIVSIMKETTIAFMSDNHIRAEAPGDLSEKNLREALSWYRSHGSGPDAIAVAGDLSNDGKPEQYNRYMEILRDFVSPETCFTGCMGNHEWYLWGWGCNILANHATQQLQELFTQGTGLAVESDTEINGFHILCASPDNELVYYRNREPFLTRHIQRAQAEDPQKPIFLVCHMGPRDTVIGTTDPETGSSDFLAPDWSPEFLSLMENTPQLIYIAGHTHADIADPRSIYQKNYTVVNCGCAGEDVKTGLLARISADNIVTIARIHFADGTYAGPPWIIDIPAAVKDRRNFRYIQTNRNEM